MDKAKRYINNPFIISFAFLIFAIVFLSIFFNKISRDSLTEQIQHRQQLSVRSASKSIETFLNSVGRTIVTLENNTNQVELDKFISIWAESKITGVVVTNENGVIVRNSNVHKLNAVGVDVSDRDYYKWAKTAKKGEYKIFPPVVSKTGGSEGKYIVTVATPMINDDKFEGVIDVAILLSDLTTYYIDNTKVLDSSKVYLVVSDGTIIYSDSQDFAGKNFNELFENNFIGKELILNLISDELKKNEDTKIKLALPNFDKNYKLEPYLISASHIHASDNIWKVVVTTPEKDLLIFTYSVFNKQIIAIFIVVSLSILLTLRASKQSGYDQAVIDEHNKHNLG